MADIEELIFTAGGLVPVHIELVEASGPVQPRHAFETKIVVAGGGQVLTLSYHDRGEIVDGAPLRDVSVEAPMTLAQYRDLWEDLLRSEVFQLGRDFIAEHRSAGSIVPSHFELRLGAAPPVRFDYLRSQVHTFAFFRHRSVIHRMRALDPRGSRGGAWPSQAGGG